MCRAIAEGGRRCTGRSCGAASARQRQRLSRARRGLEAAHASGNADTIYAATSKYMDVTGEPPPPRKETTIPTPRPEPDKPATATPANAGTTEQRIRDAVKELGAAGDWVGIIDVRQKLGDVDHDEISRVLLDMQRNDPNVHLAPECNRKALKDEDHAAAVHLGGDDQHIIAIQAPRDDQAADRVRAAGFTNATDDDLEAARLDPLTSSSLYDAIRAEQRRRQQN